MYWTFLTVVSLTQLTQVPSDSDLPRIEQACVEAGLTEKECLFFAKGMQYREKALDLATQLHACKESILELSGKPEASTPSIEVSSSGGIWIFVVGAAVALAGGYALGKL